MDRMNGRKLLLLLALVSVASIFAESDESAEYDLFYKASSENFIIRWAFQALCDFTYDPRRLPYPSPKKLTADFDPSLVKKGDMIFIRDAKVFFKYIHPQIKAPYFILTHGDYLDMFKESHFKYADDENVLGWFTIHPCNKQHPKVFPIPLGILQFYDHYEKRNELHKQFLKYRRMKKEKLCYMNFTDWRNPERKRIRDYFLEVPFCKNGKPCKFNQYMKEAAEYKFIISPPGLGPDLYRNYEALLVGTIPICKHSHMDFIYEGLPVLFIDDWEEVTEEFLNKKYKEITSKKYNPKRLYMEYWIDYIKNIRESVLDNAE